MDGLKYLAGRSRPCDLDDLGVTPAFYGPGYDGNSFPSGHAAFAFMLAAVAAAYFPRWRRPAYVLAVLIASGRLLLDKHFLSDVIVGALVGYLIARLLLRLWPPGDSAPSSTSPAPANTAPG